MVAQTEAEVRRLGQFQEKLTRRERDAGFLEMRIKGHTLSEIATAFDVTIATVSRGISRCLKETTAEASEEVRQLELARLDVLTKRVNEFLQTSKGLEAVDRALRVMDMRARLLGLSKQASMDVDYAALRYQIAYAAARASLAAPDQSPDNIARSLARE